MTTQSPKPPGRNIVDDVKKSGFPLETSTALSLSKFGWGVLPHLRYYDEDDKTDREIDIVAERGNQLTGKFLDVLIIECKKQSDGYWAFIEQDQENTNVFSLMLSNDRYYSYFTKFFPFHYYYRKKPCSYHLPVVVQKKDLILSATSQVFDAVIRVAKYRDKVTTTSGREQLAIYYPIIVFDGNLFSVRIEPDRVIPTEQNHIQLKIVKILSAPGIIKMDATKALVLPFQDIIIDVVKKEYFEKFLETSFSRLKVEKSVSM